MRERLALCASVSTLVVAVMLSPSARAQQETRRGGDEQRSATHRGEMIHGVVAGITAEGEVFYNHQTNTVVKAEAAFLTVVGSPMHRQAGDRQNRSETAGRDRRSEATDNELRSATSGGNERRSEAGGNRHNVYIVWLMPKTKVCEAAHAPGTSEHAKTSERDNASANAQTSEHAKTECKLDDLEVGDHIEVAFIPEDDSATHNNVHQSDQMRQRHGRHRTHVGYATAITIMRPSEHGQSSSDRGSKSNESSK